MEYKGNKKLQKNEWIRCSDRLPEIGTAVLCVTVHEGENTMTVREFLLKHTHVNELCVVRDSGYIVMTAWIDYEDLFTINNDIGKKIVKSDTLGTLLIRNHNGKFVNVDCHYIDV